MAILSTTMCYPNPAAPGLGIFVQRRLAAVSETMPVRVVAPIPIFPPVRRRAFRVSNDETAKPPVYWPNMWSVPGTLKRLDPGFYAASLDRCIAQHDDLAASRLIDAHFVWPDGVGAWHVAWRRGLPFVCTIRGKLVSQIRYPVRRRQIIEMLRGANKLIAVSKSLAELANEVAGRPLDITVIPNGIDGDLFHRLTDTGHDRPSAIAREHLGWSATRRYIVSVGHWQRIKGFHCLIDAWPDVCRHCDDAVLVLVGGSAGQPAYERELRRLAHGVNTRWGNDAIIFAGRQEPTTIRDMLNAADLFALTSESEGWCNAIAESLASGCPVVATDVGGNRELVTDDSLGKLVPLNDSVTLANTIVEGLSRRWDRRTIADTGGRRTWQQVARECVDVYKSLL